MEKIVSRYQSDDFKIVGFDINIDGDVFIISHGYILLPNRGKVVVDTETAISIKKGIREIILVKDKQSSRGKIIAVGNKKIDRSRYVLVERLAWFDWQLMKWVSRDFVNVGNKDMARVAGEPSM